MIQEELPAPVVFFAIDIILSILFNSSFLYVYRFNSHRFIIHIVKVVACTFSACHRHYFITVASIDVTSTCGNAIDIMLSPLNCIDVYMQI